MALFEKRVRIVSDGTSEGTHVYEADSGREIAVTGIEWELNVGGVSRAHLDVVATELEYVGMAAYGGKYMWQALFASQWRAWWYKFGEERGSKIRNTIVRSCDQDDGLRRAMPSFKEFLRAMLRGSREFDWIRNFGPSSRERIGDAVQRYLEAGGSLEGDWLDEDWLKKAEL